MESVDIEAEERKAVSAPRSFSEAQGFVFSRVVPLGSIPVGFCDALHAVLAEPIRASEDRPAFDASAVDGFALRSSDVKRASLLLPVRLRVSGESKAGYPTESTVGPMMACSISTGALIPPGADAVVKAEDVQHVGEEIWVQRIVHPHENIRLRGEDITRGTLVMEPGRRITPAVLALMASIGPCGVAVYRKPWVSVVTTGDELIPVNQESHRGKIRDSNAIFLSNALREADIDDISVTVRVPDRPNALREALASAIEGADVVVVAGGLSVGQHDHVRSVLETLGVTELFHGVNAKPGKPLYVGMLGETLVFGLPGNPLAVGVMFYEIVRPALLKMMGYGQFRPPAVRARLQEPVSKKTNRAEFIPAQYSFSGGEHVVFPLEKKQSHMLSGFAEANCLICLSEDDRSLEEGERVEVHLLPSSYLEQSFNGGSEISEFLAEPSNGQDDPTSSRKEQNSKKEARHRSQGKDPATCPFCA